MDRNRFRSLSQIMIVYKRQQIHLSTPSRRKDKPKHCPTYREKTLFPSTHALLGRGQEPCFRPPSTFHPVSVRPQRKDYILSQYAIEICLSMPSSGKNTSQCAHKQKDYILSQYADGVLASAMLCMNKLTLFFSPCQN